MNAPTRITTPAAADLGWTREERDHRASIGVHLPNEPETAMHWRVHLAAIRDQAMAGQHRADNEAVRGILREVAREAMAAVYAPMPVKRLFLMRCALASLMEAARGLERAARDEHGGR